MSSRRSSKQSDMGGELILECKAAFLSIYDDINDKIESKKRLNNVLQQSGRNPTKAAMDKYWPRNTEELSFDDFVDICRKEPVTTADDLMKAFRKIDINGDGYISLDELYKIMNAQGENMSREDVRKMIDEVDENKDGKLDYGEIYSSKRPVIWRDKIFYDQFTNMIMKTTEETKKFSKKVMERKERKKRRGEKLRNSASNMESGNLSSQTRSLDMHTNETPRENIDKEFVDPIHDVPEHDKHIENQLDDLKHGEAQSNTEPKGHGSETKGDNSFGSVTSLRSRKKDSLAGSVTSLRSESKRNKTGSQLSIRTLQDEQTGSKDALRSTDELGSKVSLSSKNINKGSQISLKQDSQGSRLSLKPVQKESMGSKASLRSYKEMEKSTDVKGADTSKHEPDTSSHKSHDLDDNTSESPKKDSPKASPRSRSDSGGKTSLKKVTPREHAQKDSGTKETPRREHLAKHDKPPLPDSPKSKDSIADKGKAHKHEKVETPKTGGSKEHGYVSFKLNLPQDSARSVGEEIDYDNDFDIVSTGRPTPRIDLNAAPGGTPRKDDKHAKEGTKDKEKAKSDEKKEKDAKESARDVKGNTSNRSVDSHSLASTAKRGNKNEDVTSPKSPDRKRIEEWGDKKVTGDENKKTLQDDKGEKSDVSNNAVRTIKRTGDIENLLKPSSRNTGDEVLMSSSNKMADSVKAANSDFVDEIFKSSRNSRSLLAREFEMISHDSSAEDQSKKKGDHEEKSKDSKSHKSQESTPKVPPRKDKKDAKMSSRNENGLGSQTSLRSGDKEIVAPTPSPRKSVSRLSEDDVPRPSPRVKGGSKGKSPSTKGRDKLPDAKSLHDWMHYTSKGCFFYEEDEIVSHVYSLKLTEDSCVYLSAYPIQEPACSKVFFDPEELEMEDYFRNNAFCRNIMETYALPGDQTRAHALQIFHLPFELMGKSTQQAFFFCKGIDTALFIFDSRGKVVTCTEQRDTKGTYGVKCDLSAGEYQVLPYTTGCRFQQRSEESQENMKESKLVKTKDGKVAITSAFRRALEDIFDLCDLDNNGTMSRDEFNWFNLRTSGEELGEEEWEVVEEKTSLENGEITKQGFIELNEMEAEDAEGDVEDLWITLTSMGMNKGLIMDEACPFRVDVYVEESGRKKPSFKVTGIESLEKKEFASEICQFTIEKADEPTKIRNMKDLYMYTYRNEYRATIVIDNRSRSSVSLQANCSRSKNVVSNRPSLDHTIEVEPQSMAIAHHLLPKSELSDWTVSCTENILK